MKQGGTQKLKDSVVTFTSILKYESEQEDNSQVQAKIYYLRGKSLYLLKYFQHALNDISQSKVLYKGQFESELD